MFHNVHFEPNSISRRKQQMQLLNNHISESVHYCNFVLGDFNYVMDDADRICYDTPSPANTSTSFSSSDSSSSSSSSSSTQAHTQSNYSDIQFQELWRSKFGNLTDISQQDNFTRFGPGGCARLDRIYATGSLFPASLFNVKSFVIEEGHKHSDHLPVIVNIHSKRRSSSSNRIPSWICKHDNFRLEIEKCIQRDGLPDNPWEALTQLKAYMQMAAKEIRIQSKNAPAPEDCKLIWFCRTFRAIQMQANKEVDLCCLKVPEIRSYIGGTPGGLVLHRRFFQRLDELLLSNHSEQAGPDLRPPPGNLQKVVSGLGPAKSNTLDALWDYNQSKPVTSREEKVSLLESHWGDVFAAKHISANACNKLLDPYTPDLPVNFDWRIDRNYIMKLVKQPKNSSPGPDGIPFHAYASIPDVAGGIIFKCVMDLLEGGTPPEDFNYSTLVLLPQKTFSQHF